MHVLSRGKYKVLIAAVESQNNSKVLEAEVKTLSIRVPRV
jgi:hypothetical protein